MLSLGGWVGPLLFAVTGESTGESTYQLAASRVWCHRVEQWLRSVCKWCCRRVCPPRLLDTIHIREHGDSNWVPVEVYALQHDCSVEVLHQTGQLDSQGVGRRNSCGDNHHLFFVAICVLTHSLAGLQEEEEEQQRWRRNHSP
jgi:hypothetical protein